MPKGNPNDSSKLLNFVPKVWDRKAEKYRDIYIAPDATDRVQGDVFLSDEIDSSDNAMLGCTAATPLAVKRAADAANTKLSRIDMEPQTVKGPVTYDQIITGDITNAQAWDGPRIVKIVSGDDEDSYTSSAVTYDGNVELHLNNIDASTVNRGKLPMSVVPHGALERLVKVANKAERFTLTKDDVQKGDSILQVDNDTMYIVIDDDNLDNPAGYQQYVAGAAIRLGADDYGTDPDDPDKFQLWGLEEGHPKAFTSDIGASNKPVYIENGVVKECEEFDDFIGSTSTEDGVHGLVPAPLKTQDNNYFLSATGEWSRIESGVTGIKGDREASYRAGQINMTHTDIGSVGLTYNPPAAPYTFDSTYYWTKDLGEESFVGFKSSLADNEEILLELEQTGVDNSGSYPIISSFYGEYLFTSPSTMYNTITNIGGLHIYWATNNSLNKNLTITKDILISSVNDDGGATLVRIQPAQTLTSPLLNFSQDGSVYNTLDELTIADINDNLYRINVTISIKHGDNPLMQFKHFFYARKIVLEGEALINTPDMWIKNVYEINMQNDELQLPVETPKVNYQQMLGLDDVDVDGTLRTTSGGFLPAEKTPTDIGSDKEPFENIYSNHLHGELDDFSVVLSKLGTDVGTVIVSDTEPANEDGHILIWIQP